MLALAQAVAAAADPLAGLRDIALPAAVSWWPLAPGWWLLLGLVLLFALGVPLWLWWRHRRRCWRWAKAELQQHCLPLLALDDPRPLLQALAALVRRVALWRATTGGAAQAGSSALALAALQGDGWQHYLATGPAGLSPQQAFWLAHGLYLPPLQLAAQAIDRPALLTAVRRWLQENSR